MSGSTSKRYLAELRERAVRMVTRSGLITNRTGPR
jgi:hypothetical protein